MTQWLHFQLCPKELKADSSRYLYIRVHCSIIHHSQKGEATHMSISKWMHKQKVVYTYSELSFILKKERNSDACYNRNEPWNLMLSRISQTQKDKYCVISLTRVVKFREIENRTMVARGQGKGEGGVIVQRMQSFGWGRWKSSGDEWWWWLHSNAYVHHATELYTYKWLQ